ncbi:MAG TPA: hypothetical protein VN894_14035 [Polyangiaceae bacterium]|nr:hypothetical protein [Polyangiaceae bacterium]
MSKRQRTAEEKRVTPMDISHLRREARTAVELAIVALAPTELVDRLAAVAGIIEAMSELPSDCAPAVALLPKTAARAKSALDDWHQWEKKHLPKGLA